MVDEFIQYEGRGAEGYKLRYLGSQQEVIVRNRREHELSVHMLPPVVKDFSKFLLCPMPGTLISCSVKPGQRVEAGQQLAVIEAMKMQVIYVHTVYIYIYIYIYSLLFVCISFIYHSFHIDFIH
jgi:acetyl/propionyl-CoA carboxylase alpha subunit